MSDADFREILHRDLQERELGTFDTLQAIPGAVADVARSLAWRDGIAAFKYLRARVPTADRGDVMEKVEALRARQGRLGYEDDEAIRDALGRDLTVPELATFASLEVVTSPVEAVVMCLVNRSLYILACRYLCDRLPREAWSLAKVGVEDIENKYRLR